MKQHHKGAKEQSDKKVRRTHDLSTHMTLGGICASALSLEEEKFGFQVREFESEDADRSVTAKESTLTLTKFVELNVENVLFI